MNIYVGNLPWETKEDDLKELFLPFGEIVTVKIITDRDSGRSRGFGFVEMKDAEEGKKAIADLDGTALNDRNLKVNEARPPRDNSRGGGNNRGKRSRW
ncbi:RNA recognition motif domain-containing protein [Candidatus Riflebacteria bacterium]